MLLGDAWHFACRVHCSPEWFGGLVLRGAGGSLVFLGTELSNMETLTLDVLSRDRLVPPTIYTGPRRVAALHQPFRALLLCRAAAQGFGFFPELVVELLSQVFRMLEDRDFARIKIQDRPI